ncbi:MAG TPA: YbaK/EbsC family protein [candidate division Zixibacteria bacterium]|nr:YbaK/EbsC family protein [candidate division Zixibacteria bacterium]
MTDAAIHPNIRRVTDAAAAAGLSIEVRRFPEGTRTARDAAAAVGCDVAQIVKSLVFVADGRPVIALLSGADRLDPRRLAGALGATEVRRATGDEAREATGYAIGGVPPLGHARPLPVLIDENLLQHEVVWAAAGLPDAVFAVEPSALAGATGAGVARLAEDRPD